MIVSIFRNATRQDRGCTQSISIPCNATAGFVGFSNRGTVLLGLVWLGIFVFCSTSFGADEIGEDKKEEIVGRFDHYLSLLERVQFEKETLVFGDSVSRMYGTVDIPGRKSKLEIVPSDGDYASVILHRPGLNMNVGYFPDKDPVGIGSFHSYLNYPDEKYAYELGESGCFPFSGVVTDGVDRCVIIRDFIKRHQAELCEDKIGESRLYRLSGLDSGIFIDIWFDPDTFLIKKINWRRENKTEFATVCDSCEMETVQSDDFNGVEIPTVIKLIKTYPAGAVKPIDPSIDINSLSDKELPERKIAYDYIYKIIKMGSSLHEADFDLGFSIPDGTPVHMQDVPQIEYIWMDGKIAPKTDEHMLAIARAGHKFMPGPKEPRFWMMTLGAALILFAIGAKIYNHRRGVET